MMAMFTFQGMGMGFRALVLTMVRGVVLVIPALLILSRSYGVYGAFAAQPAADIGGVLVAGSMLLQVYRRYPASEGNSRNC